MAMVGVAVASRFSVLNWSWAGQGQTQISILLLIAFLRAREICPNAGPPVGKYVCIVRVSRHVGM